MTVHNKLGPGFQEVLYQRALAIEFSKLGIEFAREVECKVYYEGYEIGIRRADFIVEGKLVLEIKARTQLEDVHLAQAKNYVVAYDYHQGLLINFGGKSLQQKLLFNPKYASEAAWKQHAFTPSTPFF